MCEYVLGVVGDCILLVFCVEFLNLCVNLCECVRVCTITDTFCSALFSGEHKLTSLYNIL